MPWYSKEQPTPFDTTEIPGLEFLHGDVLARRYRQTWIERKKYPLITFPSGIAREIRPTDSSPTGAIHICDGLDIRYGDSRDQAGERARQILGKYGYQVHEIGTHQLIITNPYSARSYELTFAETTQHLENIVLYPKDLSEVLDDTSRALLPPLGQAQDLGRDAVAPIKFYSPVADWTWYPTGFDGDDIFYGLVSGYEVELGIFSLAELEEIGRSMAMPVERDLAFTPKTLRELEQLHRH